MLQICGVIHPLQQIYDEISIAPIDFRHTPERDALIGPGRSLAGKNLPGWQTAESACHQRDALTGPGRLLAGKNLPGWQATESAFLFFHPDTPRRDALTNPGRSLAGKNLPCWQAAESAFLFLTGLPPGEIHLPGLL
jgi:hypothetical protein